MTDWSGYRPPLFGDVNADGVADLLFASVGSEVTQLRLWQGPAFNTLSDPLSDYPLALDPDETELLLLDVIADSRPDLVVNERSDAHNRILVGQSNGVEGFASPQAQELTESEPWSQYTLVHGNFGGTSKQDLAFVRVGTTTRVYVAIAK